jgi:hypothetical protein
MLSACSLLTSADGMYSMLYSLYSFTVSSGGKLTGTVVSWPRFVAFEAVSHSQQAFCILALDGYGWVITVAWKEMFYAVLILPLELVPLYEQKMRVGLCPLKKSAGVVVCTICSTVSSAQGFHRCKSVISRSKVVFSCHQEEHVNAKLKI